MIWCLKHRIRQRYTCHFLTINPERELRTRVVRSIHIHGTHNSFSPLRWFEGLQARELRWVQSMLTHLLVLWKNKFSNKCTDSIPDYLFRYIHR
jgi:hypothetical protein